MTIEFCLLVLIIILMYFRPSWLVNFSRTILGKLVFVILIIMCTVKNTMCGLLAALLLICLSESVIEGLPDDKSTKKCKTCGKKECINNEICPNCEWDDEDDEEGEGKCKKKDKKKDKKKNNKEEEEDDEEDEEEEDETGGKGSFRNIEAFTTSSNERIGFENYLRGKSSNTLCGSY